jgi:YidC/Oxa1 family membrane protein insertase
LAEIRNPNQPGGGGGQDSRSLLIFSAVFVLFFLGMQIFGPKKPQPEAPAAPAIATKAAPSNPGSTSAPGSTAATTAGAVSQASAATPAVAAAAETTTVVENELYRITFSNRGGEVTSWILKKYKNEAGGPLDLVSQQAAAKFGYPLSLWTNDKALRERMNQALFVASATGTLNAPATLTLTYSENGLVIKKTFRFDSSYVIDAEVTASNQGSPIPALLAWPSGFGDQQTQPDYAQQQVNQMQNGKSAILAAKKVVDGATLNGPFDWAGVSDLYFGAVFLPASPAEASMVGLRNEMAVPSDPQNPQSKTFSAVVLGAAVGSEGGSTSTRLFVGPKVIDVLSAVHAVGPNGGLTGPSIEPLLNFGFWGFIAKPLFLVLRWFHEHVVPNWGWAILLLTLVITIAMLPTRIKMMSSALKMQRVQPEMNAIREKYKKYKASDPRRADMNKEIFDLQKREGVNMFGGCLPMLLQYPLLYGFYRMLGNVIELRQAHWYWLHNLAAPDPLHILPVFFIVTMFLVQYLTPSPGMDPAQQKMMAFTMPVFFGFMTWNLGSGLTLYWAFSNVINVIQQAIMNRTGTGRQMRELAAKRAAKKKGGGQMVRR